MDCLDPADLAPALSVQERRSRPGISRLELSASSSASPIAGSTLKSPISPASTRRQPATPLSRPWTPLTTGPSEREMTDFRQACVEFYYSDKESARQKIDHTLRNVPNAYRAAYTSLQAEIRQQFHKDAERDRRLKLESTLMRCEAGSLLRGDARLPALPTIDQWRSKSAMRTRQRALVAFLRNHALKSHPGPHAFLRSLYAALWLQSQSWEVGGAGSHLIEWDIDDACFLESGPEFLFDAVNLLKGHLGFDDNVKTVSSLSRQTSMASTISTRDNEEMQPAMRQMTDAPVMLGNRDRSQSDPFLDPLAKQNQPLLSAQHQRTPPLCWRTFTTARYLTNHEAKALCRLFPAWITSPSPTKFTIHANETHATDLNDEIQMNIERPKPGHGVLRLSAKPRDAKYKGTMWQRFIDWLLRR